jgi:hypothetical protein
MALIMDFDELRSLEGWAESSPRHDEPWSLALKLALVAVSAVVLLAHVALVWSANLAYIEAPFSDAHDWIAQVFKVEVDHDWLNYLWTPHTAQRIPIARAVAAYDIEIGHGKLKSFLIAAEIAWLAGTAALVVQIARARYATSTKLAVVLVCGLIGANLGLGEDFALPIFSVYLFVAGPALTALTIGGEVGERGWRTIAFWLSLGLCTLASLGNAAGLAVWPVLLMLLVLRRADRATVLMAGMAMIACVTWVEGGLSLPSSSLGSGDHGAGHILKMATYFLVFVGLPWSHSLHTLPVQAAFGSFVVGGAIWTVLRALRERNREPLVDIGVALILFGFLTAALASVGRVDELASVIVPTRYTPFATLLQIGMVLANASGLNDLRYRRPARFVVSASVAGLLLVAAIVPGIRALERTGEKIRHASDLFDRTGLVVDPPIYPRPAFAAEIRARLAGRGLPH